MDNFNTMRTLNAPLKDVAVRTISKDTLVISKSICSILNSMQSNMIIYNVDKSMHKVEKYKIFRYLDFHSTYSITIILMSYCGTLY